MHSTKSLCKDSPGYRFLKVAYLQTKSSDVQTNHVCSDVGMEIRSQGGLTDRNTVSTDSSFFALLLLLQSNHVLCQCLQTGIEFCNSFG